MPTSPRSRPGPLAQRELSLIWGAWVELGLSGWQRTHQQWAVDPEPLIIRTAALRSTDSRLRGESLDWCIQYWRHVSRVRLRNLLREQGEDVRDAWGPYAATVSTHAGVQWPSATQEMRYATTGRSSLPALEQPSRAWLRLRAMFGLGARAEILRFFLAGHHQASTATIAREVRYAKRNVADECEWLVKAGLLKTRPVANRFYYTLAREKALRELLGDIAPIQPDWSALFAVTSALVALEEVARRLSPQALLVEAYKVAQSLDDPLDALDIEDRPQLHDPEHYWEEVRDFGMWLLSAWASGEWKLTDEPVTLNAQGV